MSAVGRTALWEAAATVVLALVVLELTRPVAPQVQAVAPSAFLDPQAIARAAAYRAPLRIAALVSALLRIAVAAGVLVWLARRRSSAHTTLDRGRGDLRRAAAAGAAVWALSDLVRFPLQVWAWRRAVDVGLSTQGFGGWLADHLIQVVPYWAGVGAVVLVGGWVLQRWPRTWVPVAGLLGGAAGVAMMVISPVLFEPLVFDFTPLPEGALRQDITRMVAAAGIGTDVDILVADASRRTTASNAYVSGIGATRRIVLYDTLLADAPDAEVLTILAHELGHARNRDVERTAVGLVGVSVLLVAALDLLVRRRRPDPTAGLTAAGGARFVAVAIILIVITGPVERWSSRRAESAADVAAIELSGDVDGYRSMMTGLARRNLSDPDPPAWFVGLFHSHPPVGDRLGRVAPP